MSRICPLAVVLQEKYLQRCNMAEVPEWNGRETRADGHHPCEVCGRPYSDHPYDMTEIYNEQPVFKLDCNGQRIKL
jgi:hypothetical protein